MKSIKVKSHALIATMVFSTLICVPVAQAGIVGAPVSQSVDITFMQPSQLTHSLTLASSVPLNAGNVPSNTMLAIGTVSLDSGAPAGSSIALKWDNPISSSECFVSLLEGQNDPNNRLRVDATSTDVNACSSEGYQYSTNNPQTVSYTLFKVGEDSVQPDIYTATMHAFEWQN